MELELVSVEVENQRYVEIQITKSTDIREHEKEDRTISEDAFEYVMMKSFVRKKTTL